MLPTKPLRREVDVSYTIKMQSEESDDPHAPKVHRPIDELSRIERLIAVSDLAITPYERKLRRGLTLAVEEERMMNTHINTLMKLEMNKAALIAKMQFQKQSNAELAEFLLSKGMEREHVIAMFGDSPDILEALGEQ